MTFSHRIRSVRLTAGIAALLAFITPAVAQEKPSPQVTVDLKPLGAAPDLFTDQSESRYQMRGVINVFWLDDEQIAVAFSTNHRWSTTQKPEPLNVRLIIFDLQGKQLHSREWNLGAEGPDGAMTLDLAPGPDNSILAIYRSNSAAKIPEGDYAQVLNADTSLRQDFYIPATSAWAPSITPEPGLVLETYYANKHSSLTWWSGTPLKPGVKVDVPSGKEENLAGPPGLAARADCANSTLCFGVRVYGSERGAPEKAPWYYSLQAPETVPLPRVFLSPTALVVELRHSDQKQSELVVIHPSAAPTQGPPIPHGLQVAGVTSVSRDGQRFSLTASREVGVCGVFDFWCNQQGQALVVDLPANRIVFQQEISAAGGTSSLSPDGKHVAIFDRDKLAVYGLP